MSIELRLAAGSLDIDDVRLNITLENPMFTSDGITKGYSFPFKIDATPNNLAILDHANRLDAIVSNDTYDATILINSIEFFEGVVVVQERGDIDMQIYFHSVGSNFAEVTKDLKLSELELDTVTIPKTHSAAYIYDIDTLPGGNGTYSIEVNGVVYSALVISPQDPLTQINLLIRDPINAANGPICQRIGTQLFLDAVSPGDVIDVVFDLNGYFSVNSVYTTSEGYRDDWSDYLNAQSSSPITSLSHTFPVIKNNRFYDGQNPDYEGYENYYDGGVYVPNTGNDSNNAAVPQITIKHILDKTLLEVDINSIIGSWINETDIIDLILYGWTALDEIKTERAKPIEEIWNHYQMVYSLTDLVPSLTTRQFYQGLRGYFNLSFLFDTKGTLEIVENENLLKTDVEDWTRKAEPKYKWTPPPLDGFTLDYTRDESDQMFVEDQLNEIIESPGKLIIGPSGDVPYESLHFDQRSLSKTWITPEVIQKGSSKEFSIGEQAPKLRLLFYRGMRNDSNSNTYPMGSNSNLDTLGASTGNITLRMEGADGLYINNWKEFIKVLVNGKRVKKTMRLSIADLINIRTFRNPRKRIYHELGEITTVVSKVTFTVSQKGIGLSQCEFYTI